MARQIIYRSPSAERAIRAIDMMAAGDPGAAAAMAEAANAPASAPIVVGTLDDSELDGRTEPRPATPGDLLRAAKDRQAAIRAGRKMARR